MTHALGRGNVRLNLNWDMRFTLGHGAYCAYLVHDATGCQVAVAQRYYGCSVDLQKFLTTTTEILCRRVRTASIHGLYVKRLIGQACA